MTPSRRQQILDALVTRLESIRAGNTSDGGATFATDAGYAVFLGEAPQLGEGDPDQAVAVLVLEDEPTPFGQSLRIVLPVDIQAVCKASIDNPWTAAEQVVADIKRAVEIDRNLDGLVTGLDRGPVTVQGREPGTTTVNVSVLYRLTLKEEWGNP